jgi:hypothetical protein
MGITRQRSSVRSAADSIELYQGKINNQAKVQQKAALNPNSFSNPTVKRHCWHFQ